jgi:predicted nuclease of predicted toxin-antitoxin system
VTAFLIDEMFPAAAAGLLRDKYGHDAVHVSETGLRGAPDAQVAAAAAPTDRSGATLIAARVPAAAASRLAVR